MITVFHLSDSVHYDLRDQLYFGKDVSERINIIKSLWEQKRYEKVAEVSTDVPAIAFHLTNHVSVGWHEARDKRVKAFSTNPRSTSVCDIMISEGVAMMVDRVGYLIVGRLEDTRS